MNSNLVSIAMATYNGEKYLVKQLDSLLNQTYTHLEIIICDDMSSDGTVEIINEYIQKDNRIQLVENKDNLGYVKNFEKAISLCSGKYIALSDQDDIWDKDKVTILIDNIGDNLLIHSDCRLIDEDGETISLTWKNELYSHTYIDDFLFSNVVTGCTALFSKELLVNILPFPKGLAYHDWYLAVYAARMKKIKYLPNTLIQYRQHSDQDTGAIGPNKYMSLFLDPIKRLFGIETRRKKGILKHLKNLESLYYNSNFSITEKEKTFEAIVYFQDYLNHYIHIKMFMIGCKYRKNKYRYGKHNMFCISNLMRELIG